MENLLIFYLNQNICCFYSKEASHITVLSRTEKHLFKLRGKKKIHFYCPKVLFTGPMGKYSHYDKRLANKSAYALNRLYIYIYERCSI